MNHHKHLWSCISCPKCQQLKIFFVAEERSGNLFFCTVSSPSLHNQPCIRVPFQIFSSFKSYKLIDPYRCITELLVPPSGREMFSGWQKWQMCSFLSPWPSITAACSQLQQEQASHHFSRHQLELAARRGAAGGDTDIYLKWKWYDETRVWDIRTVNIFSE